MTNETEAEKRARQAAEFGALYERFVAAGPSEEPGEQITLRCEALADPSTHRPLPAQGRGRGFGKPFAKGASGNPRGRPLGARSKAALLAQSLLQEGTKDITEKAIALAREGNLVALKLCFERILPRQRDATIMLDLPPVQSAADCTAALAAVIDAVAAGELTPHEAHAMLSLIDGQRRSIETTDLDAQFKRIDARSGGADFAIRDGQR